LLLMAVCEHNGRGNDGDAGVEVSSHVTVMPGCNYSPISTTDGSLKNLGAHSFA
jgi:hypothetical protein